MTSDLRRFGKLDRQALMAEAERLAGLSDWGVDRAFEEGLGQLVDALEAISVVAKELGLASGGKANATGMVQAANRCWGWLTVPCGTSWSRWNAMIGRSAREQAAGRWRARCDP